MDSAAEDEVSSEDWPMTIVINSNVPEMHMNYGLGRDPK